MCGITGIVNLDNSDINLDLLKKANGTIKHRGPDDSGLVIKNNVGLSSRRLSIIDLETGGQPISNEDGLVWIVFNGEIYNYKPLQLELIQAGHKFKTKSDTETILHLYEEKGDKCLMGLKGMFAFAIYDSKKKKILLARDRMGEKPLYYSISNGKFIFASELKAILSYPCIKRNIDINALNCYFSSEYVPSPLSICKDVKKLPAGSVLIFDLNKKTAKINKYWDTDFKHERVITFDEAIFELERKMFESVKSQMVSDVPLGLFLSGGIDSSTIAYYMTKLSKNKIKTFSIGFEDKNFDETKYSNVVSGLFGTDHREKILTTRDVLPLVEEVVKYLDEPMADSSIIPTYLLSKFSRKYVKVVLGGDGGDELFMGYQTFQANKIANILEKIPFKIDSKFVNNITRRLPVSFNYFSFDYKLKRFIERYSKNSITRNRNWIGSFTKRQRKLLLKKDFFRSDNYDSPGRMYEQEKSIIEDFQKLYLTEDILVKTDRASMANSLEVRSPFLDYELVNYVNSLPVKFKLNGLTTKYILKKLMKNRLPKDIINRSKRGFALPISKWINSDFRMLFDNYLNQDRLKKEGIFNPFFVSRILEEHRERKRDNRKELWTLFIFQIWKEYWDFDI